MKKSTVVVLGCGIGGKIVSKGLISKYPELDIFLIGEESLTSPGLFYFNKEIEGVCDKEISVDYGLLGEGSLEDYQKKSRGFSSKDLKISSFNLVGKSVKGYLLNSEFNLSGVKRIKSNAVRVDLANRLVRTQNDITIRYDYLINTVPLNIFSRLIGRTLKVEGMFEYTPVYQFSAGESSDDIDEIKVQYDLREDVVFYRHSTYLSKGGVVKVVSESIKDFDGRNSIMIPGKIVPSKFLTNYVNALENQFNNLKICGRYARWDYHYTVDQSYYDSVDFIEKAYSSNSD